MCLEVATCEACFSWLDSRVLGLLKRCWLDSQKTWQGLSVVAGQPHIFVFIYIYIYTENQIVTPVGFMLEASIIGARNHHGQRRLQKATNSQHRYGAPGEEGGAVPGFFSLASI